MRNKVNDAEQLIKAMIAARKQAGLSQSDLAKALCKSIGTIKNWENGFGAPDFPTLLEWFDRCEVNIEEYLMMIYDPEKHDRIYSSKKDSDILKALKEYLDHEDPEYLKRIHFNIFGDTGSDRHAQIDMLTIINKLPLSDRIASAQGYIENYLIRQSQNELKSPHVEPDLERFKSAIESARQSVYKGKDSYSEHFK